MDRTLQRGERRDLSRPHRSRPRLQRLVALGAAGSFVWSMVLATPAFALIHTAPPDRSGIRLLTTEQMTHIVGKQGIGVAPHAVSVDSAPGDSYPWEGSVGGTNTGNGNKQTSIPIVGWTQKGGLPVALSLTHNSQSNRNAELGNKWTHSYDIYLMSSAGGGGTTGGTTGGQPNGFAPQSGTAPNTGGGGTGGGGTFTSGSNLVAHWGDDLAYPFTNSGTDTFAAPTGIHDTLVKNVDGTFTITKTSQTKYHFNASLYCDTITDPSGNVLSINRNAAGYVSNVTDATNRRITFAYNAANQITSITDPLSRTWTIGYNASGDLTTVSLPVLNNTTYTYVVGYDTSHDILDFKTPKGNHDTYAYNTDGSLAWQQDAAGNRVSYTYASGVTTIADPNGNATKYNYTSGRLVSAVDALNNTESYVYDTSNNRTQVTDKRGYIWKYTFDGSSNVLTAQDPYLNTTTSTYNAQNLLLTVKDALNHQTTYAYDGTGIHLTSITDALGHARTFTYDTSGLKQTATDALSHQTTFGYDTNGYLIRVTDPYLHATSCVFDALGQKTSAADALNNTTTYTYDVWGRVTSIATPAGTTTNVYDADGNITSSADGNGHTTTNVYDASGRMTSTTKPNGDTVTFTYDGTGQKGLLSSRTDGNNHTTSYTYTARHEKASATYPDGTGESWTYLATSQPASRTDGNGSTTQYVYDHAGKRTGITYPSGSNPSFTYDVANRLTGMTDSTGTTGYTYDSANRLTQISEPNGTVSYGYDNANRRTTTTVAGTGNWTYAYDNANRLTSLQNPFSETASYTYDADNRTTQRTNGNGSITTYSYDTDSRTSDVWHKTSGGAVLSHYNYQYDTVSNVTQRTDSDGSVTAFGYDTANQLTNETRTGSGAYTIAYTYDHNNNRKTKVLGGSTDTYTYDAHDKLLSTSTKSYTYDNNGNCKTVTSGGQTTTLSYDYENRVVGITYGAGGTNSFAYNASDLRSRKVDSTGTYNYVTDGTDPASAVLKDSAATYTPGLSERRGTTSSFYHSDALGSTRGITSSTQAATDSTLYDGFGMTVSKTGTNPTPFGFVGTSQYQSDSNSGLQLLGHRYYDPSIGRFLTSDPAHAGTNWFAYCYNNPLRGTDPLGLDWVDDGSNFFAGWGDTLTGGLTRVVRQAIGCDGQVDPNSGYYHGGEIVGTVHLIAIEILDGGEGPEPNVPGEPPVEPPIEPGGGCFVAGTLVAMADGSSKPIEQVEPGEWVLSRHEQSVQTEKTNRTADAGATTAKSAPSETVAKRVLRTFVHQQVATLTLHLAGGGQVTTTQAHLFFVEGKGFVPAGHLAIGNAIVTRAGPGAKVVGIERAAVRTVYNLEVAGSHTFFVGSTGGGLWVHNTTIACKGLSTK